MRLEQLFYLYELSKYTSINEASMYLHLTQQSLSNSIKSLENEFGVQILNRSYQGITFTEDGEEILKFAEKILLELQLLQQKLSINTNPLQQSPNNKKTTLRVLSSNRANTGAIVKYCQQFMKKYPNVLLISETESNHEIIAHIEDYLENDLIFITLFKKNRKYLEKLPTHFTFHKLKTSSFYVICHTSSELAQEEIITLEMLTNYSIVQFVEPGQLDSPAQKKNLSRFATMLELENKLIHSDSVSYCVQGLLNNNFLILITDNLQKDIFTHPETVFIPLSKEIKSEFGYLLPENIELSPIAQKFVNLIKED